MRHLYTDGETYVTLDEIRERVADAYDREVATDEDCAIWIDFKGLTPATCSICERDIGPDAHIPLCPRCCATSQAHARGEQARLDWIADGSPD